MQFYAHSKEGQPKEQWQPLERHLENVANLAGKFAREFDAEEWGRLAGGSHDLGKGTLSWQAYLRHANGILDDFANSYSGRVEHAVVGARELFAHSQEAGKLLAYCLAGHHGGLPNWEDSPLASLKSRLRGKHPQLAVPVRVPTFPADLPFETNGRRLGYQLQFFGRMLFSCLVDADYLDTEEALDAKRSRLRSARSKFSDLFDRFSYNYEQLRRRSNSNMTVNQQREVVRRDCLAKASGAPGLFSLTVPTGGGKTLASLAFALEHAKKYAKRRIIYVIPFTSIIEQNAVVFRQMLGHNAVVEHHCNFISDDSDWQTRLASENWDAPLIVTTNVQFFDSFYSNKPSKCRKLHNVANSVVVFDEVQAIPVERLEPCLEVIRELSVNYGVTSILCTATQPALEHSPEFAAGLENVTEIVNDVPALFTALKRTEETYIGQLDEPALSAKLAVCKQVLCVVNTRQQALDVFSTLGESEENFHLSALMYPVHRSQRLAEIRARLSAGRPCRVVSTQLIEAGVDVDFAVVYRAVAGIDSIAQAAGRCNRNGRCQVPAKVFVFKFSDSTTPSFLRLAAQSAEKLFDRFQGNLTAPDCVREYFADYFWKNEQRMDSTGILGKCAAGQSANIQFAEIAQFCMIETATVPIAIAFEDDAVQLVESLKFAEHKRGILRRLQQYTVQVYPYQFDALRGWCEQPEPGVWCLRSDQVYSETTGLQCKPPTGCAFFG